MPAKDKQSCIWGGVVYPSSTTYDSTARLEAISCFFGEFAYCLHDKDIKDDGTGELKKPHIHWVGRSEDKYTASGLSFISGIPKNEFQCLNSFPGSIRYLIHFGTPDKYQYPQSSIVANFDVNPFMVQPRDDNLQAKAIFDYIISHPGISMVELIGWVMDNKLWASFRRGFAIYNTLLREV